MLSKCCKSVFFFKENKPEEISKRKPIQKQSFVTYAYAEVP